MRERRLPRRAPRDRWLVLVTVLPFLMGAAAAPRHPGATAFTFRDPAIVESSGLVVVDGAFVTTNDSGDTGRVFTVDPATGRTTGVTHWSDDPTDTEALAPAGHGEVWVGDIGDNSATRDTIQVARVPVGPGERTVHPATYDLIYPDRAHNAETLLCDPTSGRLYVATKDVFGGELYAAPAHLDPSGTNRLTPVAPVLPIATDGAFFPDGRHMILRDYGRAVVYTFPDMITVGSFRLPDQDQGEGIAVDAAQRVFVSSEGQAEPVLRVPLPADVRTALGLATPAAAPAPTASPSPGTRSSDEALPDDRPVWPWFLTSWLVLGGLVMVAGWAGVAPAARLTLLGGGSATVGGAGSVDHSPLVRTAGLPEALSGYLSLVPRLRRTSPDQPGWTRRRAGRGFVYLDEDGGRLPADEVERIQGLVIPPAWTDVWICPWPNGHLQAVGTDDAGRRQYLYHPDWRARRDAQKFERMLEFGKALTKARELVVADLGREGMPLERACAAAVRLLDLGYFRIGNDVYAEDNGSFGLTTLERRHVRRRQDRLVFTFTGKSGVDHRIEIDDVAVIEAVEIMRRRRGRDLRLLSYKERRSWRSVLPALVNEYVRASTGIEATAKDFRTWHATVLAAAALASTPEHGESKASRKRAVAGAMKEVSSFLGNTPALARSSYVDPRVVEAYEQGRTIHGTTRRTYDSPDTRQAALERATLRLLKES